MKCQNYERVATETVRAMEVALLRVPVIVPPVAVIAIIVICIAEA
jgi:hypothetical protein